MTPVVAWILGDTESDEFAAALDWLRRHVQTECLAGTDEAVQRALGGEAADLIVVFQQRRGRPAGTDMARLGQLLPLARQVAIVGSWLEGEPRSGTPLPGAIRIVWHQAPARLANLLAGWSDGRQSLLSLPQTATDTDRLLAARSTDPVLGATIGCSSANHAALETLLRVCRRGFRCTVAIDLRSPQRALGLDALAWDLDHPDVDWRGPLERFRSAHPAIPIVVLAGFTRWQHVAAWRNAGIAAVVSKPWLPADLDWHLRQAVAKRLEAETRANR